MSPPDAPARERPRSKHLQRTPAQGRVPANPDLDRLRAQVELECQQTQDGADEYADRVLHNMECQLTDILHAIQRGRQRLLSDATANDNVDRPI